MNTTPTPTIIAAIEAADMSSLSYDGGTITLPEGWTLRCTVETDQWSNPLDDMGEDMWTGAVTTSRIDSIGHAIRPDGFDGKAEILDRDWHTAMWWQVPADVERGSETYYSLRREILDLLHYGYEIITLSLVAPNGTIVADTSLGGISPNSKPEEIAADMLGEVAYEAERAWHGRLQADAHWLGVRAA